MGCDSHKRWHSRGAGIAGLPLLLLLVSLAASSEKKHNKVTHRGRRNAVLRRTRGNAPPCPRRQDAMPSPICAGSTSRRGPWWLCTCRSVMSPAPTRLDRGHHTQPSPCVVPKHARAVNGRRAAHGKSASTVGSTKPAGQRVHLLVAPEAAQLSPGELRQAVVHKAAPRTAAILSNPRQRGAPAPPHVSSPSSVTMCGASARGAGVGCGAKTKRSAWSSRSGVSAPALSVLRTGRAGRHPARLDE